MLFVILYQLRNEIGTLPIRQTKHLRRLHRRHGSGRFLSTWDKIETKKNTLPDPTHTSTRTWLRLKGFLPRSVLRTNWKWVPYHPTACVFYAAAATASASSILIVVHWRCISIAMPNSTRYGRPVVSPFGIIDIWDDNGWMDEWMTTASEWVVEWKRLVDLSKN